MNKIDTNKYYSRTWFINRILLIGAIIFGLLQVLEKTPFIEFLLAVGFLLVCVLCVLIEVIVIKPRLFLAKVKYDADNSIPSGAGEEVLSPAKYYLNGMPVLKPLATPVLWHLRNWVNIQKARNHSIHK